MTRCSTLADSLLITVTHWKDPIYTDLQYVVAIALNTSHHCETKTNWNSLLNFFFRSPETDLKVLKHS